MTKVMIIGGGIAGLTGALALQRQGITVRLFEQAAEFGEVGAGISLSQPASRGLFSLGLRPRIEEVSDVPNRTGIADYQSGERLPAPDRAAEARAAGDIPHLYLFHRADLHAVLADAVAANDPEAIMLGRQFVGFDQDSDGVTARFVDGGREHATVMIGADGINSKVRALLFGDEKARFTGQVAYRFLIPREQVEDYVKIGPSIVYLGPKRMLVRYIIRHGTVVNGVAFVKTDSWTGEGWSTQVDTEELLEKFAGWNDDVQGLLRNAPKEGTRKWALFDRDPLPRWTERRVTLMGDAAHPMLPFLGLGAAMGIEDGVVLGRVFDGRSPEAALQLYENTRRERANHVLLASRRQLEIQQAEDATQRHNNIPANLTAYDPATTALIGA